VFWLDANSDVPINVEVLGSKAGGGPNGWTRSATIVFSGAVKTLMFNASDMLSDSLTSTRT
jgi:hypothetical protein